MVESELNMKLNFDFSPNLIDHLGLEMYDSPTRAIAELIANAWDADAEKVFVELPSGTIPVDSVIVVRDIGNGMKKSDVKPKFLNVGGNRREKDELSPNKKRPLMGHKGIGKFAGFGLADVLEIHTVHEEENRIFAFRIDLNKMHEQKSLADYEVEVLIDDDIDAILEEDLEVLIDEKSGKPKGTTLILRNLRNVHRCPSIEGLKKSIAMRFRLAPDFQIFVNEERVSEIKIKNRGEIKIDEVVEEGIKLESGEKRVVKAGHVKGFIALAEKPLRFEPGVLIYARNRSVEMNTRFDLSRGFTGQIYTAYLHGEIQAEWLDTREKDLIRTDRGGIRWETDEGTALEIWGQKKIKKICAEEAKKIKKERLRWEERPEFRSRYLKFTPPYRRESKKVIDSVIRRMVGTETEKFIDGMINLLLLAFENRDVFLILQALNESDVKDLEKFSEVLREWSIVELTHMAQVVGARLDLIEKLKEYIKNPETLEFPTMQKFLEKYPWLLNPMYDVLTANDELSKALSQMALKDLEKEFSGKLTKEELRKKPDFICLAALGRYIVIEIKRPKKKAILKDAHQLQRYWAYVCKEVDKTSPDVTGLLIAHDFDEDAKNVIDQSNALSRLRYKDLWRQAHNLHKEFLDVLEKRREEAETETEKWHVEKSKSNRDSTVTEDWA